jgi:hypothetical protein
MGNRFSTINLLNSSNTVGSNVNIDSGVLFVDGTNNRVGVGTTSPSYSLDIFTSSSDSVASLRSNSSGAGIYRSIGSNSTFAAYNALISTDAQGQQHWYVGGDGFANTLIFKTNGSVERMRIDSSGRITAPYQTAFSAWGSSTQSWSGTAAYQILQLNQQSTLGSRSTSYNTSTYRFTAPVTGTYLFLCKITQTTAVTGPQAYVFVNGAAVGHEIAIVYSPSYLSSSGSLIVQMNANDYADLRVVNNNNVTQTLDLGRCSFDGHLIG